MIARFLMAGGVIMLGLAVVQGITQRVTVDVTFDDEDLELTAQTPSKVAIRVHNRSFHSVRLNGLAWC